MSTSPSAMTSDRDPAVLESPGPHLSGPGEPDVVVGVDGSESALGAVRWATHEAARRGAPLRIVHAARYLGPRQDQDGKPPGLPRARQITGTAYTVARRTDHAVAACTEVVDGEPVAGLLARAADSQLIVLGSTTTGAFDEYVLAPVAVRVAAGSTRPVVIVPQADRGPAGPATTVAVLGLGEPDDDPGVLEFAAAWARRAGTSLLLLQTQPALAPDRLRAVDLADLDVERRDLPDPAAHHVLTAAGAPRLLVLSTGRGTLLHRYLDSPHRWLLRHCTAPMALIPTAPRG